MIYEGDTSIQTGLCYGSVVQNCNLDWLAMFLASKSLAKYTENVYMESYKSHPVYMES
jgi:hypothetical protein